MKIANNNLLLFMELFEDIVLTINNTILENISNDKFNNEYDRREFIQKYNKRNFSKFKNTKVSNSELLYLMNRVNKYKKIYSCIIIQKYYRRHLINNSVIL